MTKLITARQVIDGTGHPAISSGALLVEKDRIVKVGKRSEMTMPAGTETVDLGDCTLLPGLIDMHGHLGMDAMGIEEEQLAEKDAYIALQAAKNARVCLASGVTMMRIVGEKNFIDVAYRRAIEEGVMPGPRTLISTRPLVSTGGYGVFSGLVAADGPYEVRKIVRENIGAGADLIKLFVTGGGTYHTRPKPLQEYYTFEEIRAAVEVAHSFGKRVAVHAQGGPGTVWAIEAGVDTIDHGHLLSDDEVALMAKKGTALVATVAIHLYPHVDWTALPFVMEWREQIQKVAGENIRKAKKYGVQFTMGTDAMHGLMWFEVACAVHRAGLTPMEAITAATKTAAEICGLGAVTGTLEAGKWADLIAVASDPLDNIEALSDVRFVMKQGHEYDPRALVQFVKPPVAD